MSTADAARPAADPLTLDTHVDIPRPYMREARFDPGNKTDLKVDLGKMERGGLDAAFFVIFVEQGPRTPEGYAAAFAAAERKTSAIEEMVRKYPNRIRLAKSPEDVLENHAAGRLSAMMGIENGFVIGKDLARLDALYARGARYLGLTHTGHNDICTSSGLLKELGDTPAPADAGLSAFGETVVRRANALGMMVDVSHSSDACVRDVLRLSAAPIIASHSSARALTKHSRNLSDELMRGIAAKGGVVQIVAYTGFLKLDPARDAAEKALEIETARQAGDPGFDSAKHEYLLAHQEGLKRLDREHPLATLDDYLDHIQHAVSVAGIDHVGLSSDFDGGGAVQGWNDASQTRNVTAGLRKRGFTDAQITLLWSGNLLRVWRDVERTAHAEASAQARRKEALDGIFDAVMTEYHLPGMALGVVEDGKVTYTRTAGELVSGGGQDIDADTLFKIASNTKAMTTGLLARLVDAGKLKWDDPVVKFLPQFKMSEPWITREMRVRDLLIHNSGLREGAGDLMLWPEPNQFTRADIIAGLPHLKPVQSFRSRYAYDNLLYIVAGEVAAAAGGASYEELVRREVFDAVGLKRCQVGEFDRDTVGNVAQPHYWEGDRNVVFQRDPQAVPAISSAAAGGVRCSLNDMLTWMRMWLDPELRPPGQDHPWVSRVQHQALWTPQTPMPMSEQQKRWNNGNFSAYGYGWRLTDVDGVLRVGHTGTLGGMYSAMNLLPGKRSGFVFMINGEGSRARSVLNAALVKQFTAPDQASSANAYIEELKAEAQASPSAGPAHLKLPMRRLATPSALATWLGRYRDPWFGEISVCERDGHVKFNSVKSPLMAGDVMRVGERWLVDWEDSVDEEPWLTFKAGKQVTLTLAKVDPDGDFSSDYEDLFFTRIGDCKASRKAAPVSDADAILQIDKLMSGYSGAVPGASVLVLRDGNPVVRRSYGFADLERRTPASADTNYRLASVTKQFTAAAILTLNEVGKLTLDDPIRKWLPELPEATQGVTIRHLLTHTGGLIDYEDFVPDDAPQVHDADVLQLLAKPNRVYFAPGASYRYSNSGYSLLSLIVERASGRRFAAYLHDRIFLPLGMHSTVAFEDGRSTVPARAYGYSASGDSWSRTDQSSTSAVLGDGGIYSSINDLVEWDKALYDNRLLTAESRKLAFTPATHTDNPSVDYGFGWRITGETLWHSGETRGFRNVILRYPERKLTVVVLTNRNDPEPYSIALDIARLFLAESGHP